MSHAPNRVARVMAPVLSLLCCEGKCGEQFRCTTNPRSYRVWDRNGVERVPYTLCDEAAEAERSRGNRLLLDEKEAA
jgi:hypothetical protein